jgi:hypothetical protein
MSRSGYGDYDCDYPEVMAKNWRGAVLSAMRGRRGQAFLKELDEALSAMEEKRLTKDALIREPDLIQPGEVCALGALGKARGIDMSQIDPEDYEAVARAFGIAPAMAQEIMWMNDERYSSATPEQRHADMQAWIKENIKR